MARRPSQVLLARLPSSPFCPCKDREHDVPSALPHGLLFVVHHTQHEAVLPPAGTQRDPCAGHWSGIVSADGVPFPRPLSGNRRQAKLAIPLNSDQLTLIPLGLIARRMWRPDASGDFVFASVLKRQ